MMRRKFIFLAIGFAMALGGCSVDDGPNFHFTALTITDAELPESFDFGETYQINVTYVLPDGCTFYEGFDISREDTAIRNVVVIGAVRTDAEVCTQEIIEQEATFDFQVIYDESYTFKFFQGENNDGEIEYLEVVVPVN